MIHICTLCCVAKREATCGDCAYYTAAQQYRAVRRAPAALPDGHFIAEINPEVERAVNDALELAQKGKTDQAWTVLNGLLREHPRNHTVCYGMGALHAIKGEIKASIRWFDKAIAIFPYFVEAHFNKAVAYRKQFDVGNAIRAYRKVVEYGKRDDPIVEQAHSFLDSMTETIRRHEGVDLDTYLQSMTEFDAAFALMAKGNWLRALEGFRACVALTERHAPSHGNMGLCYAKLGHKAKALAELNRALEIDPQYEPAMTNRLVVERMEEGRPLDFASFQSIEYSKQRLEREKSRLRPFFDRPVS
jgi:tetratricopeptide (TPR) repeat protein